MDTAELMKAARQGKLDVIDKYLDDGGNPNVHDEVCSPCVSVNQIHLQHTIQQVPFILMICFNFQAE